MHRRTLNLGIVAHVDAGKTTLTERLLYAAGVIDELGSVDAGTTQTDYLALERQRGITIKAAVVAFAIDDVAVNLIDTPGHPDFIAEVERVLSVLDGAVLVVSAVEGVQPQTRILMRALRRLRLPTLLFVNKIDRAGADAARVLAAVAERLTPDVVAMGVVDRPGTRAADFRLAPAADAEFGRRLTELLAEHDEALLAAYVEDDRIPDRRLRAALAQQTSAALVHPVFFGSALTGAGLPALMKGLVELLPASAGDADGPLSAVVFKVERGGAGEKVAYARLFSGTLRVRDRVLLRRPGLDHDEQAKVTAISVFEAGAAVRRDAVAASQIAKLWGLGRVQIGDTVGAAAPRSPTHVFAPPALQAVVVPRDPADKAAVYVALTQLAEQDPLIDVGRDEAREQIFVSLYGEVQKQVIEATLASDFGLAVEFAETTPIYIERPAGTAEALELLHAESNPFLATMAIRVEAAAAGSGVELRLDVDPRAAPLYLYKALDGFREHIEQYVREALREGLFGWQVTDCVVTVTRCEYSVPDGPPSRRGPLSTAADFRRLTPLVLMQALARAGTVVCEPVLRAELEVPAAAMGGVVGALGRLGALVETQSSDGSLATIQALVSAARLHELRRELSGLTGGEGVLEASSAGYRPVSGEAPRRRRTTPNPLNLDEYMLYLRTGQAPASAPARVGAER